jgi:ribosomal protein S17E
MEKYMFSNPDDKIKRGAKEVVEGGKEKLKETIDDAKEMVKKAAPKKKK